MQILVALVCVLVIVGCSRQPADIEESAPAAEASVSAIDIASQQLTENLISMPGVAGVAVSECDGEPCIKVMLEEETAELMQAIPSSESGFPVVVEVSGEIRAQEE